MGGWKWPPRERSRYSSETVTLGKLELVLVSVMTKATVSLCNG